MIDVYRELFNHKNSLEEIVKIRTAELARSNEKLYNEVENCKLAEVGLGENEALLKEAQRIAHVGHWKLKLDTGMPIWSDELFRIYGLDPKETKVGLGHGIGMIHPNDSPPFLNL